MPEPNINNKYNLRNNDVYRPYPFTSKKFQDSFFPSFGKKWCSLSSKLKCERDTEIFKQSLKSQLKPKCYKYFNKGSKIGCSLATQLRVGRSKLNSHQYPIGLSDTSSCLCHNPHETTSHYILECFLYQSERQILVGNIEQYIPNFKTISNAKKLDIILNGYKSTDPDYYHTNIKLQLTLQQYILTSKRFNNIH